ncbi:hypothetical protein J6590_073957 [Homalodisca vitripennis]|nr:hypothetical protein J6590_073957 [Homalodisca vitripennis]
MEHLDIQIASNVLVVSFLQCCSSGAVWEPKLNVTSATDSTSLLLSTSPTNDDDHSEMVIYTWKDAVFLLCFLALLAVYRHYMLYVKLA